MSFNLFDDGSQSLVKQFLTPEIFQRLSPLRTGTGFTLARAIRSGVKNPDSGIGIYAGDAETYTLFRDIFQPVIRAYHGIDRPIRHPLETGSRSTVLADLPDPDPQGEFIRSTRIRVARNLDGFAFPPHINARDRQRVESLVRQAVQSLPRDLWGAYYPMAGLSPDRISERAARYRAFEPGDRFQADAGINRDFPDGRGIYASSDGRFMIWVNEEDHLRVISMDRSAGLGNVFRRLETALASLAARLEFCTSPDLGHLSSCPTNIGTAMRAGVHICLPRLEKRKDLLDRIVRDHGLQIRGTQGEKTRVSGAVFDISNRRRLGISETRLIRGLHAGITAIIRAEKSF